MYSSEYLLNVLANFRISGSPVSCVRHGKGHINRTFKVDTDKGCCYILQGINSYVFKNPEAVMHNFTAVTEYALSRAADRRSVLQLIPTLRGESHYTAADGTVWRVTVFVENSVALEQPEKAGDLYRSSLCIGKFLQLISGFPAGTLEEIIPDFHNTPKRFRDFKASVSADKTGRAKSVAAETAFALEREAEAGSVVELNAAGKLPLRVSHNDAKLTNVLFDKDTREGICLIDLDTIMPGFSVFDFGEAARSGACSSLEDEPDLGKVYINLDNFREIVAGFIEGFPSLNDTEIDMLPTGMKLMTLENGIRFLGDYIDGDLYFSISRENHNLDRARVQFKMVEEIEKHIDEMNGIVREEKARCRGLRG